MKYVNVLFYTKVAYSKNKKTGMTVYRNLAGLGLGIFFGKRWDHYLSHPNKETLPILIFPDMQTLSVINKEKFNDKSQKWVGITETIKASELLFLYS